MEKRDLEMIAAVLAGALTGTVATAIYKVATRTPLTEDGKRLVENYDTNRDNKIGRDELNLIARDLYKNPQHSQ